MNDLFFLSKAKDLGHCKSELIKGKLYRWLWLVLGYFTDPRRPPLESRGEATCQEYFTNSNLRSICLAILTKKFYLLFCRNSKYI